MSDRTQLSIHPRNWRGSGNGEVSNTCAPRNPKRKGKLVKKQARLLARRNDHSMTLRSLPTGSNPAAYRSPGSMAR